MKKSTKEKMLLYLTMTFHPTIKKSCNWNWPNWSRWTIRWGLIFEGNAKPGDLCKSNYFSPARPEYILAVEGGSNSHRLHRAEVRDLCLPRHPRFHHQHKWVIPQSLLLPPLQLYSSHHRIPLILKVHQWLVLPVMMWPLNSNSIPKILQIIVSSTACHKFSICNNKYSPFSFQHYFHLLSMWSNPPQCKYNQESFHPKFPKMRVHP